MVWYIHERVKSVDLFTVSVLGYSQMINRINNNNNQQPSSGGDDDFEFTEKYTQEIEDIQQIEELLADTAELKKVAARTVLRATEILDINENNIDVAKLFLAEAVVMMQVVYRIETFFNDESDKWLPEVVE